MKCLEEQRLQFIELANSQSNPSEARDYNDLAERTQLSVMCSREGQKVLVIFRLRQQMPSVSNKLTRQILNALFYFSFHFPVVLIRKKGRDLSL